MKIQIKNLWVTTTAVITHEHIYEQDSKSVTEKYFISHILFTLSKETNWFSGLDWFGSG
jgi:hypothetical protein